MDAPETDPPPSGPEALTETSLPFTESSKTIRADAETFVAGSDSAPAPGVPAGAENELPSLRGYTIEREIASGGMGTVYLATQKPPGRQVALKVVRLQPFREETVRRFEAEVGAVAKMDHPGIITIYEVGAKGAVLYFSMTLIEGGSLREAMEEQRIGVRRALVLVRQIADALHYAHQRGIVHRDVKPENILLSKEGAPYLTDFGLARDLTSDQRVTATGTLAGTPLYMSPEQARADKYVDHRTDVYSLGATLYELLALRPPFQAASVIGLLAGIANEEPTRLRKIDPRIPRDVETLVEKAMRKNPNDRYTSAEAFALDLGRYLEGRPIEARPVAPIVRLFMAMRRNPLVSTLAALVLVAGLVGAGVWDQARRKRLAAQEQHFAAAEDHFKLGALAEGDEDREQEYLKALEELNSALALGVWDQRPLILRAEIRLEFLKRAEREGDRRLAQLFLADMREAVQALEPGWKRRDLERLTQGDGSVRINLLGPGSGAASLKVVEHALGPMPAVRHTDERGVGFVVSPAPMGLYAIEIEAPGSAAIRYPLWIGRLESRQENVRLLAPGEIPPDMVYVPAGGVFVGGQEPGARDALRADVPGFLIDRHEVTFADYAAWLATLPPGEAERRAPRSAGSGRLPVSGITWDDAGAFAAAQGKRLPRENEWTLAARGADPRPYSFGWRFDPARTNVARPEQGPAPVGSSGDVSPYGCQDMAGNVSELVADAFWPDQPDGPRVRRGGAWTLAPHYARVTYRDPIPKSERRSYLGFRCAKDLPPAPGTARLTEPAAPGAIAQLRGLPRWPELRACLLTGVLGALAYPALVTLLVLLPLGEPHRHLHPGRVLLCAAFDGLALAGVALIARRACGGSRHQVIGATLLAGTVAFLLGWLAWVQANYTFLVFETGSPLRALAAFRAGPISRRVELASTLFLTPGLAAALAVFLRLRFGRRARILIALALLAPAGLSLMWITQGKGTQTLARTVSILFAVSAPLAVLLVFEASEALERLLGWRGGCAPPPSPPSPAPRAP